MTRPRVLVVGSTGMLGGTMYQALMKGNLEVLEASRSRGLIFDAEEISAGLLLEAAGLSPGDFVVNCVGLTKGHIRESDTQTVERALRLNVLFPIALSRAAEERGVRVIQVATDCVFSGIWGKYSESSPHDATDVYGKTKSLGEVKSDLFMHLRCSLIGPEGAGRQSLFFEWVRAAEPGAQLKGFTNHRWNGLTALTFAQIVAGIIEKDAFTPGVHHLVPADEVTKFDLIKMELDLLEREDVFLEVFEAEVSVDRTLVTENPTNNSFLFDCGGYERVPTIHEMMEKLPWEALRES